MKIRLLLVLLTMLLISVIILSKTIEANPITGCALTATKAGDFFPFVPGRKVTVHSTTKVVSPTGESLLEQGPVETYVFVDVATVMMKGKLCRRRDKIDLPGTLSAPSFTYKSAGNTLVWSNSHNDWISFAEHPLPSHGLEWTSVARLSDLLPVFARESNPQGISHHRWEKAGQILVPETGAVYNDCFNEIFEGQYGDTSGINTYSPGVGLIHTFSRHPTHTSWGSDAIQVGEAWTIKVELP